MKPLLFVFAALLAGPAIAKAPVAGFAKAKDGDSLTVGDTEVRLFGIDAPEFDQSCTKNQQEWSCGTAAAEQLSKLVTGKHVVCGSVGVDEYKRVLGRCMAGATDVNRTMVALGYAVAFRRYSSDYVSAEESAKVNKRGIWAGKFQMPSDFRRSGDLPVPVRKSETKRSTPRASSNDWQARASSNCNIKGNRNRKGQWIYHVPGMPYYDQTRPEEMFCTEAEARAAGYRRAIVR